MQTNFPLSQQSIHGGIDRTGDCSKSRRCFLRLQPGYNLRVHNVHAGHGAAFGRGAAFNTSGGFSLIEVVLALGVVTFAFVALFGMLPVGLNAFNNSIDATMEAQIAQSVMSQLRQAKFSQLGILYNDTQAGLYSSPAGAPSFYKSYTTRFAPPQPGWFYDDQGNAATISGTTAVNPVNTPVNTANSNYIYSAGVQVYYNTWNISQGATAPFGQQPEGSSASTTFNASAPQPAATVIITISKSSAPNVARIYTGYISNNGF